jgi:apolipoprotein N-acyltransferase
MQMAQMRALETGRYLIRGTNDGITAVVDPQGKITDQLPQFERGVLKSEVYAMKGLTPLMQYGTLPFLILSGLIVLVGFKRRQAK